MTRRPLKIVRIIARLNTGGPTIHTVLLTRGLAAPAYESVLVTGKVDPSEGDMTYYAAQLGVTPVVVPELGRRVDWRSDFRAFRALWQIIRRERPDIIHTHTAKAGFLGRAAGLLANIESRLRGRPRARMIHTFHGHVFHGYFSPLVSRCLAWAERAFATITDTVITVSETVKRDLTDRYAVCRRDRVVVVPLGLDFGWVGALDDHAGELRRALEIPASRLTIGVVGRLTRIKNHRLFLAAVSQLRRSDVTALLVGDGELREALETEARLLGVKDRVIFVGWLQSVARMYADLDIVCLSSTNEGTPVALIEAMAAGRPVVSTRVGGVEDLMVGEPVSHAAGFEIFANGILVPSHDPERLAAALAWLADRPDLRRAMGAVGQSAVLKRYSAERLVQDMDEIYRQQVAIGEET
jgi:glycosyltransferase involved in cell wall biosynthesis